MSETKRVVLRVPATLPADGVHCGACDLEWRPLASTHTYCSAWGEYPLAADEEGLVRCPECLAAEEREPNFIDPVARMLRTIPAADLAAVRDPGHDYCAVCSPGRCRCEEDRR